MTPATMTKLEPGRVARPASTKIAVQFVFAPSVKRDVFQNVRLTGSWDGEGRYSDDWSTAPMERYISEDGCPCYRAQIGLDETQAGWTFRWGVIVDGAAGKDKWGITSEVRDPSSFDRSRAFSLRPRDGGAVQEERYYLTHNRRLGAQKHRRVGAAKDGIRFSVWAPNARAVEVVFGTFFDVNDAKRAPRDEPLPGGSIAGGYIADDGQGMHPKRGPFPLTRGDDGVWVTAENNPRLEDFAAYDHKPYMYRITKDDGTVAYKSDLYARCQVGSGKFDPEGKPYSDLTTKLDGPGSCSAVVDSDQVTAFFADPNGRWPESNWVTADQFWKDEKDLIGNAKPVPRRVDDLVIYELHVGALGGPDKKGPGTLKDAIDLLDYLVDLGVNAVELLPMSQFSGEENWGYGTSHYYAIEYSGGGRDQYKYFIKACHRRGIAVIFDVVYNHFTPNAGRAEWGYDTNDVVKNPYYWYEGVPSDYPAYQRAVDASIRDLGGYVDNMSTGFAPRFYEETVRKMFISSAVMLMEEFHVDGFRVDQTTSIHSYNVLHADGRPVPNANLIGAKFLRELTSTLRLIKPDVILTAEDHSGWDKVTQPTDVGGLGFDAVWYADFYHHLIGDTDKGSDYAKLIKNASYGDDRGLAMDYFAGTLSNSGANHVVYNESHDEAGNAQGTQRTIVVASNGAPLIGETRRYAEARCRFAFGASVLSAGTPMFLFGEEIGAQKDFLYNHIFANREDLYGERLTTGKFLFAFYRDLIRLRLGSPGLRTRAIDMLHVHDANRVLAWRRWGEGEDYLVLASLNNHPFRDGYEIANSRLPDGRWKQVFNSDSARYGGDDAGNDGVEITSGGGALRTVIPANGFIVLKRI
ncbi:MAG: alpha-amylase family glycosyl hydrolase [Isosphaerales bacterium]